MSLLKELLAWGVQQAQQRAHLKSPIFFILLMIVLYVTLPGNVYPFAIFAATFGGLGMMDFKGPCTPYEKGMFLVLVVTVSMGLESLSWIKSKFYDNNASWVLILHIVTALLALTLIALSILSAKRALTHHRALKRHLPLTQGSLNESWQSTRRLIRETLLLITIVWGTGYFLSSTNTHPLWTDILLICGLALLAFIAFVYLLRTPAYIMSRFVGLSALLFFILYGLHAFL